MTIRDYIRSNLGETYEILVQQGGYDGQTKPDVFGNSERLAMIRLFTPGTEEADLDNLGEDGEIVKQYVAAAATRRCIPVAIDYVQQRMGQQDRIGTALRGDPVLAGETRTFYDRISTLQKLDAMLLRQLEDDLADFMAVASSLLRVHGVSAYSGPASSSVNSSPLTTDPASMQPLLPQAPFAGPFSSLWSEVVP